MTSALKHWKKFSALKDNVTWVYTVGFEHNITASVCNGYRDIVDCDAMVDMTLNNL